MHVFVEMNVPYENLFSYISRRNIYSNFFHLSAEKLFKLICRAQPDEASPDIYDILTDTSTRCDPCQRIQNGPKLFRVSFSAGEVFLNACEILDAMYIDGTSVHRIVDEATRFSAEKFLPGMNTKQIRNASMEFWCLVFTGTPDQVLVDRRTSFGESLIMYGRLCNNEFSKTGIKSYNSFGLGE